MIRYTSRIPIPSAANKLVKESAWFARLPIYSHDTPSLNLIFSNFLLSSCPTVPTERPFTAALMVIEDRRLLRCNTDSPITSLIDAN
ncbi:hypothetical protein D3C86_1158270 [compost metagenome]